MLTTLDYYMYLFPNYHPARIIFLTYQPFVLSTTAGFTYYEAKVNTRRRILVGYTLFFLSSLAVILLDVATSGRGGIAPFVGTCVIAASFGVANGHVQGGMSGDLSLMCPEFIQSFYAGIAASGALTSALRFITKAAFENSRDGLRKGAMLFSAISCFFGLLCVSLESPSCVDRLSTKELLHQNKDYAVDMFLIYLLTFAIVPGFLAEDTGSHGMGSWYGIVLIACTYTWDLISSYMPLIEKFKLTSRKWLLIAVVSRFLLVPAFYYTVKHGGQGWMILLTSFLGLSHGYLSVSVMTEAPKGYKGPEQNALGNLLAFSLLGGIFVGAVLDWLWLIGKGW
ncbi:hypothetical protein EJB05_49836, partial [Eragrostis curvula]